MADKVSSADFCREALKGELIGTPYKKLDCQALVEKLLARCGVKNPATGKAWNWRGSNHMWRSAVHDRHKISSTSQPTPGAWVFTIKDDGGEIPRGYHDDMQNAAHVGVYLGDGVVQHSTTGGVQWDSINSKRWTHWALANQIDYDSGAATTCECWRCKNRDKCAGGYKPAENGG